ncbi:hypothetical protein [Caulobacter phage Cr30]|uniref:hypothetical protein n=1 Tax=Caulobacter phage Cr30 TaxID=1357714 RepID=UPI0004A9B820|nr:hypothetical protein OZ74_gp284 [Caulobacter phage Cr30]AGS81059.1 hypothetical protein [Caulobacter phage Cr30]
MAYNRPPPGSMCYWRYNNSKEWKFGYCTYVSGYDMIRLGRWNGDDIGGPVVSISDIEWKEYKDHLR